MCSVKILGIETSCDETSVALVENGRKIFAEKYRHKSKLQNNTAE